MFFHSKCSLYVRQFLNKAMSRYTSNSNTCISQKIPQYQNAGFRGKNENILVVCLTIHDKDISELNNSASNLKQIK